MEIDNSVYGVLNYQQLENFCKKMSVNAENLKANFDGWRKLVLYTEDLIFLFPRNPDGIEWLDTEISAYEFLNKYNIQVIPRFIERVRKPEISFYEFAAVSRLKGEAYSKYEKEITYEEITKLLEDLARLFTLWHNIPLEEIPSKIKTRKIHDETIYHWELKFLDPKTTDEAFNFVLENIKQQINKNKQAFLEILISKETEQIWRECLKELVSLDSVLLHSDIHEDQILIDSKESMNISGIIDWETVRVGNPVWEFNFFEWGFGIWKWWKHFSKIRSNMWEMYLSERRIQLKYSEGLDLFYTLSEFLIVLDSKKSLATLIENEQEKSIQRCLEKLVLITEKLKKEKR